MDHVDLLLACLLRIIYIISRIFDPSSARARSKRAACIPINPSIQSIHRRISIMAGKKKSASSSASKTTSAATTRGPVQQPRATRKKNKLLSEGTKVTIRIAALTACTAYFASTAFFPSGVGDNFWFPWGPPAKYGDDYKLEYASPIDYGNDGLQFKYGRTKKIVERDATDATTLVRKPETVLVEPRSGTIYLMTEESMLVKLTDLKEEEEDLASDGTAVITARATYVRDLGLGRPVGGKFSPDGKTLWIADGVLGLVRIRNVEDARNNKPEVVLSHIVEEAPDGTRRRTPIAFADDVCVGPKTGKVYFSDASDIPPEGVPGTSTYDLLYASKLDLMRGGANGTGRIVEYDPKTDETRVLVRNLRFANGVSVDKHERYLFFTETYGTNVYRYRLSGEDKGKLEVVVPSRSLPGFLDNIDCSWPTNDGDDDGKCYAVMPTSIVPIVDMLVNKLPSAVSVLLRGLLMSLPKSMAPEAVKYCGIVEYDIRTNRVTRLLQDPTGQDVNEMNGVTVHDNKLYLASLQHNYIIVHSLE